MGFHLFRKKNKNKNKKRKKDNKKHYLFEEFIPEPGTRKIREKLS